jgi:hypothetical protein
MFASVPFHKVATDLDPYWANVVTLLGFQNGFTDDSAAPKTWTARGTATTSTAQSKFGGRSLALDGAGSGLAGAYGSHFNMQAVPFTVEMWVYLTSYGGGNMQLFNKDSSALPGTYPQYAVGVASDGKLGLNLGSGTSTAYLVGGLTTNAVAANTWTHVALSVDGSTGRLFIGGQLGFSVAVNSASLTDGGSPLFIGGYTYQRGDTGILNDPLYGYVDEFRVTKGVARYTSNFAVPTTAFPRS